MTKKKKHRVRSGESVQVVCPMCRSLNPEHALKCDVCGYCLRCPE